MDVEGHYKWIVFLPSKQYDVGALTRYYGVFKNGEIKIRGIEARQRNTPEYIKEAQLGMLNALIKAENKEEFKARISTSIEILVDYAIKIIKNEIKPSKLILKNRVSKNITGYKINNLVKSCLMQLRDIGNIVEPGQYVRYIVTDEKSKNYKERVKIPEFIEKNEEVDIKYYLRQLARCGESILIPFGYNIEKLEDLLLRLYTFDRFKISEFPHIKRNNKYGYVFK
jgi:DNA polymerase elongation subunit (family B)